MHIPLRLSPFPRDIDPTRDESNVGQSLAFPVLTTSVNCAFPLSEKANVLTGTKAKVIQIEITKATGCFEDLIVLSFMVLSLVISVLNLLDDL